MFTYYGHIRSFTCIGKYYDSIMNAAFDACPPSMNWVEIAETIRKEWDEAIKISHTALGMTDEEFYNFLKALDVPGMEPFKDQFINSFEESFMRSFNKELKAIG